jgi:hypothetical protein
MSNGDHGNEGPPRDSVHHHVPHDGGPYWRRAHRDWRFWAGLILMLTAITVYVVTDNLAFVPHR